MSILTRLLLACTIFAVIALCAFSWSVYPDLPARIPTHFNASGVADGFGPRSMWWTLPIVSVLTSALVVAVAIITPQRPALLNVPNKPEILALPPAAQRLVVRQAQPALMALAPMTAAIFGYIQYASWQVATGRGTGDVGATLIVVPLFTLALVPAMLLPVQRELRRQQAALDRR